MNAADPASTTLVLATGWVVLAFVTVAGGAIAYNMWTGGIDLTKIISEPNGDASMSRFQLLIFTFVIAVSLFLVIAQSHAFPAIPQGVLVLLGISGSSYLVSKGIQFSSPAGVIEGGPTVTIVPQKASVPADGTSTIQFEAVTVKTGDKGVTWSVFPPSGGGTINGDTGLYTAPAAPPASKYVVVQAISKDVPAVFDVAVVELA